MINDIMIGFKSIMNDRYVKEASTKIKEIKRLKTEKGNYMGFIAPYGYKKVKNNNKITLEIDNNSAYIVKRIFTEIAKGSTRKEVAKLLNEENIISPMQYMQMTKSKNKRYFDEWSDKIIYRIIRNRTYTGDNVIRKSIKPNYRQPKRNCVAVRDRKVIENTHPQIISKELFEQANSKVRNCNRKQNRISAYDNLLTDLIICGECGNKMKVVGRMRESRNVHFAFYCNKRTNKNNLCTNNRKISDEILKKIIADELKKLIAQFVKEDNVENDALKNVIKANKIDNKIRDVKKSIENHNNNIRSLYLQKTKKEINLELFIRKKEIENSLKKEKEIILDSLLQDNNIQVEKEKIVKKYSEFITEENIYKCVFKDLIKEIVIKKDRTILIKFNFKLCKNTDIIGN